MSESSNNNNAASSWRERRKQKRLLLEQEEHQKQLQNRNEDDGYVPFVSAAKRFRMERDSFLEINNDDDAEDNVKTRQNQAKQRKLFASLGTTPMNTNNTNSTENSSSHNIINNDEEKDPVEEKALRSESVAVVDDEEDAAVIGRNDHKSLLEQATDLLVQQQDKENEDNTHSSNSRSSRNQKLEEDRILREASKVQTNALQAASELAQGVVYKKPMTTSWSLPRALLRTNSNYREMRKRWHILVEGDDDSNQQNCPPPVKSFAQLKLPPPILTYLKEEKNIRKPTPIQMQGLPVALAGRDMVGIAFTGSGKTVTFSLPLVLLALEEEIIMPLSAGEGPIGIIMAPSRELVRQTYDLVNALCNSISAASSSSSAAGKKYPEIRTSLIIGGEHGPTQLRTLKQSGVHCMVATPGRLKDFLKKSQLSLDLCRYICLDEADRMLDLGFDQEVAEIMNFTKYQRQTLLFSATFPQKFRDFAKQTLVQPIVVNVGRAGAANLDVIQEVEYVKQEAKIVYLLECLQKTAPPVIIFCERKGDVDDIHEYLLLKGVHAVSIHGGKDQEERNEAILLYKQGKADVLVATDIAAKGLDFADIQHVINFDMPTEIENYVHRIGRTGRCGKTGVATTFINKSCEETTLLDLKHLLKEAQQRIPPVLMIMDDPLEQLQQQQGDNATKGCSFCGGLGHSIIDCPKIDKDANRVKRKDALASGDGYGGDW